MLGVGDDVAVIGAVRILDGRDSYGHAGLTAAAGRFSERWGHLVRSQGRQLCDAGDVLKATAADYAEMEILAPARFNQLASDLPAGTELM